MEARSDRDETAISAHWDRIRQEERLDHARHIAQDAERDARITAQLASAREASHAT